jgi:hypothetical protein
MGKRKNGILRFAFYSPIIPREEEGIEKTIEGEQS